MIMRDLLSIADGESPISTPLTLFLVQLLVVVSFSKLLGLLLRKVKQPMVIAEVITGIILGPSVFGHIPNYSKILFPASSIATFNVIAQVGLIIFLFIVGLELDVAVMKKNMGVAMFISLTAIVTPFLLGLASSYAIYKLAPVDPNVSFASFLLFVGVAMSITAFPVLARIMTESKLIRTRVGVMALSAAAVDDVIAWCILAIVVAIARATSALSALYTFLMLLAFLAVMFLLRFLLHRFAARRQTFAVIRLPVLVMVFLMVFLCAWYTEIIGVHAIFGGFVWGICVPRTYGFNHKLIERIEDIIVIVFLPLYFTYSGLRTNISSLNDGTSVGLTILIIFTACVGKIVGATAAARIAKNSWRESFTIGILMNTKGLVELIVLNVGLDVGVLNTKVFSMFVIMAIVTTVLTQPLLHFVYLRHIKQELKEKSNEKEKSKFSLVSVAVNNQKTLRHMVKLCCSVYQESVNMKVTALLLQEVSDRPSSFLQRIKPQFTEWKQRRESQMNLIRDTVDMDPETGMSLPTPEEAETSEELKIAPSVKSVKFELSSKIVEAVSAPMELVDYLEGRHVDVLLFVAQAQGAKQLLPSLVNTISIAKLEQLVARAFDFDVPELAVIRHSLENSKQTVAVLVENSMKLPIKKVLWIVNKQREAAFMAPILTNMSGTDVTILSVEYPEAVPQGAMKFVTTAKPFEDGLEHIQNYDLVVLAGNRATLDDFSSVYVNSAQKKPVLIVYPPKSELTVDLP